jgi:nitroreductase
VQNFMVAARALGIGTALTTVIRIHTAEVFADLGIPSGFEIAALVPMGRPRGRFGIAHRKPVEALTHWNEWGVKRR